MADVSAGSYLQSPAAAVSLTLTLGCLGWAWLDPASLTTAEIWIFGVSMLLTGLPHGATDHVVYQAIRREQDRPVRWDYFFGGYLLAILLYALLWIWIPAGSMLIFLGISAWHFGQSQYQHLRGSAQDPMIAFLYLSWGTLILLALLTAHPASVAHIVSDWLPLLPEVTGIRTGLVLGLGGIYISLLALCVWRAQLSLRQAAIEVLFTLLLLGIFEAVPLLVGFALYFGGWHAPASMQAEIQHLRMQQPDFGLRQFVRAAWPLTLISVVGIGMLLVIGQYWPALSPFLLLFIAVSALTLPHLVVMHRLYEQT
ncbi:MAG: Brp/Blh family beta-carotene 15,15'-dioxygenase [Bacteroidia bacterium]|nr:Brp/Blh family beta-carotene 15,15'-dioxygenase [Bacteroidia bacterium]